MFELINSKYKVSLFENLYTVDKPLKEIDINELIEIIKYGYLKNEIKNLRNADNKKIYNSLKKDTLPAVTLSGLFSQRKKEYLTKHSGLMQVDLDHINNYDEVFLSICQDRYTYVAFKSPGGKGIKIIVKINASTETHLGQFTALEKYYKEYYDIKIDPACKDLARTMLLSHDPDLYCNPNSYIFELIEDKHETKKSFNKTNYHKSSNHISNNLTDIRENIDIIEKIATDLVASKIDITDTYDKWIKIGFSIVSSLGEIGRQYFHQISSIYTDYNIDECDKVYSDLLETNNGSITIGSLIYLANDALVINKQWNETSENVNELYKRLKNKRLEISKNHNIPAFVVFSDKVLTQIVKKAPKNKSELLEIKGIGEHKINEYGDMILEIINENHYSSI